MRYAAGLAGAHLLAVGDAAAIVIPLHGQTAIGAYAYFGAKEHDHCGDPGCAGSHRRRGRRGHDSGSGTAVVRSRASNRIQLNDGQRRDSSGDSRRSWRQPGPQVA